MESGMAFPYEALYIPFPGSIMKHMCYQLAQEAEKGHGWGNDGEEEPGVHKEGSIHCLAIKDIVPKPQFWHVLTDKINWFIVSNYLGL